MTAPFDIDVLRIGWCAARARGARRDGGWQMQQFPALAFLLRHPVHGATLFDTGYGRSFFAATNPIPERLYRALTPVSLPEAEFLPARLRALGVPTLDRIVLSHLHADHVAGLFDLPDKPPVLCSDAALAHLRDLGRLSALQAGCPQALRKALLALDSEPIEASRPVALPEPLAAFGTGYDLFGDGAALTVPLPGHGHAQFGLWLPQTNGGPVLLAADGCWSLQALRDRMPPPSGTLAMLGDAEAYLRSFEALCNLHRDHPHITILPSHCPEAMVWQQPAQQLAVPA